MSPVSLGATDEQVKRNVLADLMRIESIRSAEYEEAATNGVSWDDRINPEFSAFVLADDTATDGV